MCLPSARTPPHGPPRPGPPSRLLPAPPPRRARPPPHGRRPRGPASRLPCATRRRGPSPPPSDRSWRRAPASAPMPSLVRRPSTPCLAETSPRLHTHTARRLRRHRPPHAVPLATLAVGAAAHVRVASAGFAPHRLPLPAVPVSVILKTPPLHEPPALRFAPPPSVPSATPALHTSPCPAPLLPMTTPIVDAPTSSVHPSSTPCLAPTSRQPLGSPPPPPPPPPPRRPASPPPRLVASGDIARFRRPSRCARRRRRSRPRHWRRLRIIIVAGDPVHVHDPADHRGYVLPRSGDDDGSQRVGDDQHGAAASPLRPLHVEAIDRRFATTLPALPAVRSRSARRLRRHRPRSSRPPR